MFKISCEKGCQTPERGIRAKTTKPPAMRVVSKNVIQNNHHSFYNEGVQAIKIRKNGDYNG